MSTPFDVIFWVYFVYFLFAVFISFYVPGHLFTSKLKLNFFNDTILSTITGLVLFSLQGFIFGYLSMRFLSYLYLSICFLFYIKIIYPKKISKLKNYLKTLRIDFLLLILILIGTIIQLTSVFFNGIRFKDGLYFCCGIPDTLYHLALTNELIKNFPPNEPGISGTLLQNYHFLSNLNTAELVRIFSLPLINTQYQYMTLLLSILLGLTALTLAQILNLGTHFKRWFILLIYFAGDILFFLPYLNGHELNFSFTTLENASSLWISPSRFYSLVILLGGLSFFALWLKRKDTLSGVIMAILFGSLIGFKVYTGAIILAGLGILAVIYFFQKKFHLLFPILLTFLLSLALYLPVNSNAGGLIFSGFWRFEDFASQTSLGISKLELARRVFLEHDNAIRVLFYDLLFGFLYIVFSSGILILGLLQTKNSLKKIPTAFTITLISGLITSCFLGFFFLQKIGGANSSQFLISIYIIGAFFTALSLSWWLSKIPKKLFIVICFLLIVISSTRVLYETSQRINNITQKSGAYLSNDNLDAFLYLSNDLGNGAVLVSDENKLDCIFITFLANKPTHSCTSGAPGDRGVNLKSREEIKNKILFGKTTEREELIQKNNVTYLYLLPQEVNVNTFNTNGFTILFKNSTASIYKYNSK